MGGLGPPVGGTGCVGLGGQSEWLGIGGWNWVGAGWVEMGGWKGGGWVRLGGGSGWDRIYFVRDSILSR